jgi:uncharacterized membrane protein
MYTHTETGLPATQVTEWVRATGLGPIVFAIAMFGLGLLTLLYGDFALQWQPVPQGLPWRQGVVYLSGIITPVAGIGLLIRPIQVRCALTLTLVLLLLWVLPQVANAAATAISVGSLLGLCETLAAMTGALILWLSISGRGALGLARRLFGIACIEFGLSHFVYADFTAEMIPHWLPLRLGLAYVTGAGHLAAGMSILLGIRPRLAATLEALMMSSFVILVHVPSFLAVPPPDWAPTPRVQLTAFFWASTLAASAWIVARSFRDRPSGSRAAGELPGHC